MYAPITDSGRAKGMSSDSYSGYSGATRNLIFLDGATLRSHQLFETNRQLVSEVAQVGHDTKPQIQTAADPAKPVKWLMYRVVREDTDADGVLDDGDLFSVGFSDAAGDGYADVLPRVARLFGTSVQTDDRITLAYVSDGRGWAALVDIPTRTVLETQEITGFSIVPASPPN